MILLTAALFLIGDINFYVDPVVYKKIVAIQDTAARTIEENEIFYAEFNCEIPYSELHYQDTDSGIRTQVIIPFEIVDTENADTLADTLYRSFALSSFSEAARQQVSFLVQFGLHLPEGHYKYRIDMISGDKVGAVESPLDIDRSDYDMSDILCASEIVVDTSGKHLKKGSLKVVPLPSRRFSEQYSKLFIYFEIYDIIPDAGNLEITYEITDTLGQSILDVSQKVSKKYASQAINAGLNIAQIPAGTYDLKVSVHDPANDRVSQKSIDFKIAKKISTEISYEGLPYYDDIEYFLTPDAFDKFQGLPKGGKAIFLKKFWSQYNYAEISERFAYADENLGEGLKPGSKTDRGRIYIKYGHYDQLSTSVIERRESRPYEIWEYENGVVFIFVDIRRTNEFTLVWTNSATEKSEPTLYEYLPESVKQELPTVDFD
jgi:GWxTD domain-containing protein